MRRDVEPSPLPAADLALDLYLEQTLRQTLALIAGAPDERDVNTELAALVAVLRARRRTRMEVATATAVSLAAVALATTAIIEHSPRSSGASAGALPPASTPRPLAATTVVTLAPTTFATLPPTTLATLPPTTLATLPPTTLATLPPTTLATLPPMPLVNGADVPDPFAIVADGETWVFATNSGGRNVPAATHTPAGELLVHDALPVMPGWSDRGWTWAPAIAPTAGRWTMWFSARHRASGRQCVGAARAASVEGPYTPGVEPLLCDVTRGGAIDASPVVDDGRLVLLFKFDGNCCGLPTSIAAVELDPTGMSVIGGPVELITADQPWEAGLVEAPSMRRSDDGGWLLLYSANFWESADYAVGVARCETPLGPCRKQAMAALDDDAFPGAGGAEFVPGSDVVVLHEWAPEGVGYESGSHRRLRVARVEEIGTQVMLRVVAA